MVMKTRLEARGVRVAAAALCAFMASASLAANDTAHPQSPTAQTEQAEAAKTVARIKVLLTHAEKHFHRFKRVKPLKDVRTLNACDDCIEGVSHEATYPRFHAGFLREPRGHITLFSMWTAYPAFPLPLGLRMGQSPQQVRALMGAPSAAGAEYLLYATGEEVGASVNFSFTNNKMAQVSWHFPVPH